MTSFIGTYTVLITLPLMEKGRVAALKKLVEWQIEREIHGLIWAVLASSFRDG